MHLDQHLNTNLTNAFLSDENVALVFSVSCVTSGMLFN